MKKILSALILIQIGYCASPQSVKNNADSENAWASAPLSVSHAAKRASTGSLNVIRTKAVRDFKKTFKNVGNEKWYEMPDGYRANFTANGIRYRLDYDKNGNWLHTIRYYDEKKLPIEVRRLVVSSYLDHSIRFVEEIEAPRDTIFYIIHLEGQTNWINIKVYDDEITIIEKINK
ncbi:MAG TPA: PepSY-like domain-containing protein [Chitinophagaceae bacterium]|nr:PepSY-like domain-containing protein [Chitinophagaceae bacterium]